jgi:hypothetical protein
MDCQLLLSTWRRIRAVGLGTGLRSESWLSLSDPLDRDTRGNGGLMLDYAANGNVLSASRTSE